MPDRIVVTGLRTDTVIGLYDWERLVRQTLLIDLDVACDLRAAGASDRVEDTVDYKRLTTKVRARVESSRYLLIETLACDIAECCLAQDRVERVRVTVRKPGALRHADDVAVMVERKRGEPSGRPPHRAYVGVGSNIDPVTNVRSALTALHECFGAVRVSQAYRTRAVGYEGADDFLNLAVELRTDLDPVALHAALREIEAAHGRERHDERNAPRTLDLDLLLWDDVVRTDGPVLPDPLIPDAPFVLVPLADIARHVMHPTLDRSIGSLRDELPVTVPGVSVYSDEVVY